MNIINRRMKKYIYIIEDDGKKYIGIYTIFFF